MKRREFIQKTVLLAGGLYLSGDNISTSDNATEVATVIFPFEADKLKFKIADFATTLRRAENCKLKGYFDSEGKRTIGYGFNLDVPNDIAHENNSNRTHTHAYAHKDPSSEALWEAAGLSLERFHTIHNKLKVDAQGTVSKKSKASLEFAKLFASDDITQKEAQDLRTLSIHQSVYNAMAYCADFKDMTASQQMGLCELVYQLGTHLEGFKKFLAVINDPTWINGSPQERAQQSVRHWGEAQDELIDSEWYRHYHKRGMRVVAMLDPEYNVKNSAAAEARVLDREKEIPPHPLTQDYIDRLRLTGAGPGR